LHKFLKDIPESEAPEYLNHIMWDKDLEGLRASRSQEIEQISDSLKEIATVSIESPDLLRNKRIMGILNQSEST